MSRLMLGSEAGEAEVNFVLLLCGSGQFLGDPALLGGHLLRGGVVVALELLLLLVPSHLGLVEYPGGNGLHYVPSLQGRTVLIGPVGRLDVIHELLILGVVPVQAVSFTSAIAAGLPLQGALPGLLGPPIGFVPVLVAPGQELFIRRHALRPLSVCSCSTQEPTSPVLPIQVRVHFSCTPSTCTDQQFYPRIACPCHLMQEGSVSSGIAIWSSGY